MILRAVPIEDNLGKEADGKCKLARIFTSVGLGPGNCARGFDLIYDGEQ